MPCLDIVHKPPSVSCAKKALGGKFGDCHQRGLTEVVYQSIQRNIVRLISQMTSLVLIFSK